MLTDVNLSILQYNPLLQSQKGVEFHFMINRKNEENNKIFNILQDQDIPWLK